MPILKSQAEVAAHYSVTKQCITKWKNKGMPVRKDGKFNTRAIDEWRAARGQQSGSSRGVKGQPNKQGKAKSRKLTEAEKENIKLLKKERESNIRYRDAKAELEEYKLKVRKGELIDREDADARLLKNMLVLKQSLKGMGARLAPRLIHLSTAEIKIAIDEELALIFDHFSRDIDLPKDKKRLRTLLSKQLDKLMGAAYES